MKTILLKQKISNLKEEGFTDIEREINITQAHVDGDTYNQFFLNYFISYTKNGVDVSHMFRGKSTYDWYINDSQLILQRDENFQPVLNDAYKNLEVSEGGPKREPTDSDYVYVPAFTYVMGIFEQLQAISYEVLRMYILENDADGKWDLTT